MKKLIWILFLQVLAGMGLVLVAAIPFTRDLERRAALETSFNFAETTARVAALSDPIIETQFRNAVAHTKQLYWDYLADKEAGASMTDLGFMLIIACIFEAQVLFWLDGRRTRNR